MSSRYIRRSVPRLPVMTSQQPSITAVVVLYERTPAESESLTSLVRILQAHAELAASFRIIVYDNSSAPQAGDLPQVCPIEYLHASQNGGLAPAYNYALHSAHEARSTWLLLFDQDTILTPAYVTELVECARSMATREDVGAIVPKLEARGVIYSPESDFLCQMRHQFSRRHPVERNESGVLTRRLTAYNSGAAIRVDALRAVGGFPREFWLDYLDHATFHAVTEIGLKLCVMRASLEQNLSHLDLNQVPHWRHRSVLSAQTLFVVRNGCFVERLLYRFYLLRKCRLLRRNCKNQRVWKEMLLQAILLKTSSAASPAEHAAGASEPHV
jgi:GT2 family glycosyltransferase